MICGVLLVAANLRVGIAVVGPLLPTIADDIGLSGLEQGVLTALPVAAFALASLSGAALARRWGLHGALAVALALYALGMVTRSLPVDSSVSAAPVFAGTAMLGGGVAVANVLLPAVVRHASGDRVAGLTGSYIAVQTVAASCGAALAVPAMGLMGSWRGAAGVWVLLVLVAAVAWWGAKNALPERDPRPPAPGSGVPLYRSTIAWRVSGYFGLQSAVFFVLLTWLPTIERDLGISAAAAGRHLGLFLIIGIGANLILPWTTDPAGDQRRVAMIAPAVMLVAVGGLAVLPDLALGWAAVAGLAAGYAMPLSLSLIAWRARPDDTTGALSAMVQSTGYAGVTAALLTAGVVRELGGSGTTLLAFVGLLAGAQLVLGWRVGGAGRA